MPDKEVKKSSEKLHAIREHMNDAGVDAYLIPREDEWQGEYVPESAQRLKWLTGFTGSAGIALMTQKNAAVFSDSRYSLQLEEQLAGSEFEAKTTDRDQKCSPENWLISNLKAGDVVGYDPALHTVSYIEGLKSELDKAGIKLQPTGENFVDKIWDDRPDHPDDPAYIFPDKIAGFTAAEKRAAISEDLQKNNIAGVFLSAPDSIAWLLNIRGNDVPHVPVVLSYALLHDDGHVDWFVPYGKVSEELASQLGEDVGIHDIEDVAAALTDFRTENGQDARLMMDMDSTSVLFKDMAEQTGIEVISAADPCIALKAQKNSVEIEGLKKAHIVDGVAVTRLLKWIDEEASKGGYTEKDVEAQLLKYRQMSPDFTDDSFDTIAGWADNGAVVHYRATDEKHSEINGSGLLLVDSGGQYLGEDFAGTTDITRTVAIGEPTQEMKENFTRVLKGHIGIAALRFPYGKAGSDLDLKAREALWDADLDYGHGTGHGVGYFLSVHEGGTGMNSQAKKAFEPGMFLSNEPGFYKKDEYGIRIENLVLVESDGVNAASQKVMLHFNTVSFAPIDRNLIVADMLFDKELEWLNDYHAKVFDNLSPHMDEDEVEWLEKATAPIVKPSSPAHNNAPRFKGYA